MLNLSLTANSQPLFLGGKLDTETLLANGFRNLKPYEKMALDISTRSQGLFADNATVHCFESLFTMVPGLDPLLGPFQCNTALAVFSSKFGIYRITAQLLKNAMIAENEFHEFSELCEKHFGVSGELISTPGFDTSALVMWNDNNSRIIAEHNPRGKSFSIHWRLDGA